VLDSLHQNRRKYVPNLPHGDAIIMSLSAAQILNAFIRDPETLNVQCSQKKTKKYCVFILLAC